MTNETVTWEFLEVSAYGAFRKTETEHVASETRNRANRIEQMIAAGHDFSETVYD